MNDLTSNKDVENVTNENLGNASVVVQEESATSAPTEGVSAPAGPMATCPRCALVIHAETPFCPRCGTPIAKREEYEAKAAKQKEKKTMMIAGIALGVALLIVVLLVALLKPPTVDSVELSEEEIVLRVGERENVKYTISPSEADDVEVEYGSSNNSVATVDALGTIEARGEGSCTITITAGKKKDTLKVTVKKAAPDFQQLYRDYCSSSWADVGDDGSYLSIDTNPYNYDDFWLSAANNAIEELNKAMGLPSSLYNDMLETSWSMGKQEETYESIGITVTWTYHPDKGMEVVYKLIAQ